MLYPVLAILLFSSFLPEVDVDPFPSDTLLKLSDDQLMDTIERLTFQYFWDGAEPTSGMARERIHLDNVYPSDDRDVVTSGGSGFGIMAIIAGIERHYISRKEGVDRMERIVSWLEEADAYHGIYPHWLYGPTGKTKPFSKKDDGGDIVESSYLFQGLLCARQYLRKGSKSEQALAERMDALWRAADWDFYRGEDKEDVLFWHWSPNYGWEMNFRITGYNECLITYVLACSSPTHPAPVAVYHKGWAKDGEIAGMTSKYGYDLELVHNYAEEYGGPLFWSHYAFLGLDPRGLSDRYADYWTHNRNHALINYSYCVENPRNCYGYGPDSWGLTSSYSTVGYAGHAPGVDRDKCVISPTAALSSIPYTPEESMAAMRHFYEDMGERLLGKYGFYDAFNEHIDWFPRRYLAIDQGPIVVMIENHRSGLLWDLFMSCEEVQAGLTKMGFSY